MKIDINVYISYAYLDSLELTEGGERWVDALRRALQLRLAQLQGRAQVVVLEDKLSGNEAITDEALNKVRRAGAFVAIVSPRYAASEWARKELELFVSLQASRGLSGNPRSRIFKVIKTPVPLDQQPPELQSLLGYDFFGVDADTGRVREFRPSFGNDADSNFWLRLDELAHDIGDMVECLLEDPTALPAERVLLGVSAPVKTTPGGTFTARFVAYAKTFEALVQRQLLELDRDVDGGSHTVLGLPPDRKGHWRIGTPVAVRVSGVHLRVEPPTRAFEWNGSENLLSFVVSVEPQAPACVIPLCFEAFIEGVSVAFIPLTITIGAETGAREVGMRSRPVLSSAFASYASRDASLVASCLSALKRWDPGLDIFMDCLDLTPNEEWQGELQRVIPSKEVFLLFWSVSASESPWVAWELQQAKASKGLGWIRPMPIDDPAIAPPPDDLKHLHFGDRYLMARQAFLRRSDSASGRQGAAHAAAGPSVVLVYLIVDRRDAEAAHKVADCLFGFGFDVAWPIWEGEPAEIRAYHEESLATCDAVIIYSGESTEPWVRRHMRELRKLNAIRTRPFTSALVLGPPESVAKRRFRTHQMQVLDAMTTPVADVLQPFGDAVRGQ